MFTSPNPRSHYKKWLIFYLELQGLLCDRLRSLLSTCVVCKLECPSFGTSCRTSYPRHLLWQGPSIWTLMLCMKNTQQEGTRQNTTLKQPIDAELWNMLTSFKSKNTNQSLFSIWSSIFAYLKFEILIFYILNINLL